MSYGDLYNAEKTMHRRLDERHQEIEIRHMASRARMPRQARLCLMVCGSLRNLIRAMMAWSDRLEARALALLAPLEEQVESAT